MSRAIAGILLACLATIAAAANPADEAVFDMHEGRLYALYARELKANPNLKGRLLVEMQIATDGRVATCRVVNNGLPAPGFGDKVCRLVREFQFGQRPSPVRFTREFSFFPAH